MGGSGALVVVFWALYTFAIASTPRGIVSMLIYLTCPIALGRNHPQTFFFVLVVNAITYALAGTVVEIVRRQHRIARA